MQQNPLPPEPDPWAEEDLEEYDDKGALDRFAEVFTSPSEAFEGLNRSPNRGSIIGWGLAIGAVVVLLATILVLANPEVTNAMIKKSLDKIEQRHEAGKLSDEEYDQAVKMTEASFRGEGVMAMLPYVTGPIGASIGWAIAGALVLAVASILRNDRPQRDETGAVVPDSSRSVTYSTALAAYLIALMIPSLERIVYSLGMYFTGDPMFSLDPNLLVRSEDAMVKFALGLLGPLTLWWFFVLGTGISSISGCSRGKAIAIWVAIFVVLQGGMAFVGSMFGGM
jgi:hypothetical protein